MIPPREAVFLRWATTAPEGEAILSQIPSDIISPEGRAWLTHRQESLPVGNVSEQDARQFLRQQLLAYLGREVGRAQTHGSLDLVSRALGLVERLYDGTNHTPLVSYEEARPTPREVIATGVDPLDAQISGLSRGELGIVSMPPGRGKTALLINFAVSALIVGRSVHYITVADQSIDEIVPRIDTCILGTPAGQFTSREELQNRHSEALRKVGAPLWLSDFTAQECSLRDVEHAIDACHADLVIVDHADDVQSPYSTDPTVTRHSLRVVYQALKRLAVQHQVPIWTASQSHEHSWFASSSFISDMAEAKVGKASGAAIVLGFSGGGREQNVDGTIYCTIAKARRFYTQRRVPVCVDFSIMRFW